MFELRLRESVLLPPSTRPRNIILTPLFCQPKTPGAVQAQKFASKANAEASCQKLIQAKVGKGYKKGTTKKVAKEQIAPGTTGRARGPKCGGFSIGRMMGAE